VGVGFFDRFRQRLRGGAAAAAAAEPAAKSEALAAPAEEVPQDPFEPFARALGVEVPAAAECAPEEEEEDRALSARLLEHFAAHRPGPTSFPSVSLQILNLVVSENPEVSELARLVGRDPAMSAGVLSVANSAYYRGLREIETVRDAVTRLGLKELGRVAGAVSVRTLFNTRIRAEQVAFGELWSELFRRAVVVGSGAAWLAMRRPGGRSDRAYLGGLLHDVGKSMALRSLAALVAEDRLPRPDEGRLLRVLDRVHVEIGGAAHQEWNLPQYLTVMAVRHHDPAIPPDAEFAELHAVRLAAGLEDLESPFGARAAAEVVDSARALSADPFLVRSLKAELREAAKRSAALMATSP